MMISEAIKLAAEHGCELVPVDNGRRMMIRAIAYDADPYELDERRLLSMSADEFVSEWLPPRFEN